MRVIQTGSDQWRTAFAGWDDGHDPVRQMFEILPRPLRFLGVGGAGLITDLAIFTLLLAHAPHPLLARLVSLVAATLVTWRLNRALTFDKSGRRATDEAMRYAMVAGCAQAASYSIFAALIVSGFSDVPQLAVLIGAGAGAAVSYVGQLSFAFRPQPAALKAP
ncbi:MAG TPA: GtrA family protein [Xanthobacteraceae bacterium]|jgi:putative flippase GtrA|nr:GtrA family protein [Xanthobacteraceae bacterium]